MDAAAVRHGQARRAARQHQPGLPVARTRLRAAPVRLPGARRGTLVQDVRLPRDGRRGPRRLPGAGAGAVPRRRGVGRAVPPSTPAEAVDAASAELSADDAINIQYTSGTTGFPKGATLSHHNLANNGFFVGEICGYTEHDRIAVPVPFYHCFGMVMANLAALTHGSCIVIPAPAFEPGATLAAVAEERCTSLYGVPTMFLAELEDPHFRELRPVQPAHRHHGRLAVPGRGDEAGDQRDGHGRGDHLLRHDRDLPGLDPDPAGRRPRPAGLDRRPAASAHRGEGRRPGDRAHAPPRGDRRVLHPRLLGDARLLGGAGEDGRGDRPRPAGCTPATSRRWTTPAT